MLCSPLITFVLIQKKSLVFQYLGFWWGYLSLLKQNNHIFGLCSWSDITKDFKCNLLMYVSHAQCLRWSLLKTLQFLVAITFSFTSTALKHKDPWSFICMLPKRRHVQLGKQTKNQYNFAWSSFYWMSLGGVFVFCCFFLWGGGGLSLQLCYFLH